MDTLLSMADSGEMLSDFPTTGITLTLDLYHVGLPYVEKVPFDPTIYSSLMMKGYSTLSNSFSMSKKKGDYVSSVLRFTYIPCYIMIYRCLFVCCYVMVTDVEPTLQPWSETNVVMMGDLHF